jgi:hypothetical protein
LVNGAASPMTALVNPAPRRYIGFISLHIHLLKKHNMPCNRARAIKCQEQSTQLVPASGSNGGSRLLRSGLYQELFVCPQVCLPRVRETKSNLHCMATQCASARASPSFFPRCFPSRQRIHSRSLAIAFSKKKEALPSPAFR